MANSFDQLLIQLDVLNFATMPLAEYYRSNLGLTFEQLMVAIDLFLSAPNVTALTVTEITPFHGEADGLPIKKFVESLADSLKN